MFPCGAPTPDQVETSAVLGTQGLQIAGWQGKDLLGSAGFPGLDVAESSCQEATRGKGNRASWGVVSWLGGYGVGQGATEQLGLCGDHSPHSTPSAFSSIP